MPTLQTIAAAPSSRIFNHTELGRGIRRVARQLLPYCVETYDHGFQDGGCLTFARGLQAWSKGNLPLWCIYDLARPKAAQHLVARYGDICMDSDGAATPEELLYKFHRLESDRPCLLAPYDESNTNNIPYYPELVERIERALTHRLGEFDIRLVTGPEFQDPEPEPAGFRL